MSLKCNVCGATLNIMTAKEEEVKKFAKEHLGSEQPEWHRALRRKNDEDVKRICERWVKKR